MKSFADLNYRVFRFNDLTLQPFNGESLLLVRLSFVADPGEDLLSLSHSSPRTHDPERPRHSRLESPELFRSAARRQRFRSRDLFSRAPQLIERARAWPGLAQAQRHSCRSGRRRPQRAQRNNQGLKTRRMRARFSGGRTHTRWPVAAGAARTWIDYRTNARAGRAAPDLRRARNSPAWRRLPFSSHYRCRGRANLFFSGRSATARQGSLRPAQPARHGRHRVLEIGVSRTCPVQDRPRYSRVNSSESLSVSK